MRCWPNVRRMGVKVKRLSKGGTGMDCVENNENEDGLCRERVGMTGCENVERGGAEWIAQREGWGGRGTSRVAYNLQATLTIATRFYILLYLRSILKSTSPGFAI